MDIYDFAGCGIYAQPLRDAAAQYGVGDDDVPYWLAQLATESTRFTRVVENLNYRASSLFAVCNGRNGVDGVDVAQSIINRGAQAVAEALYGGSWGAQHLGNTQPGDAFNFIGHGLIQTTGRWNHHATSIGCFGDDRLVDSPSLLTIATNAARAAAWFWMSKQCNGLQDVTAITHRINGGENGLAQRQAFTTQLLSFVPNN